MQPLQPTTLGIYLHLPWCTRKCPYCDFNAYQVSNSADFSAYNRALELDVRKHSALLEARSISSIYIGGGTPSIYPASYLCTTLELIGQIAGVTPETEVTIEANPGDDLENNLPAWMDAGVNRISLGIQSFDDARLEALDRTHDSRDNKKSLSLCDQFPALRVNIDLMYGTPEQSAREALDDLQQAIDYGVSHISWYEFTIESNTYFARYNPTIPGEQTLAEIEERGSELLRAAGFEQYEISAWRRDDPGSHHNLNYWLYGDYLGIGAGAHSKLTRSEGDIDRVRCTRMPADYISQQKRIVEPVLPRDRPFDFMLNRLRILDPFSGSEFERATGVDSALLHTAIGKAQACGWLAGDLENQIEVTEAGWRYLNDLILLFHPDEILR